MRTGVVVSNFDPKNKGRIIVRTSEFMEKVDGQYVVLDDDLPWFSPAPNSGTNGGTCAIPEIGSRVYVDGDSLYNMKYYGQVEIKKDVKALMNENAEQSDKLKVILFNKDSDEDYIKMFYLPEQGLTIDCYGHSILLTKFDGVKISSKEGCDMEMTRDGDINIKAKNNINISCNKLNLTEGSLDEDTVDRIVLGSRLQDIFNNHIHPTAPAGEPFTYPPVGKIKETDFSKNIRISKGDK